MASSASQKAYAKRTRQTRKAAGLCSDCAKPRHGTYIRCLSCIGKQKVGRKQYYAKKAAAGLCEKCSLPREGGTNRCNFHLVQQRGLGKLWRTQVRDDAFAAYGGYKCVCCGETERLFLDLDHVNGGGNKHRASLHKNGSAVYWWLKQHGYPKGMMQPLCSNCNQGKSRNNGVCPHTLRRAPEEDGN